MLTVSSVFLFQSRRGFHGHRPQIWLVQTRAGLHKIEMCRGSRSSVTCSGNSLHSGSRGFCSYTDPFFFALHLFGFGSFPDCWKGQNLWPPSITRPFSAEETFFYIWIHCCKGGTVGPGRLAYFWTSLSFSLSFLFLLNPQSTDQRPDSKLFSRYV